MTVNFEIVGPVIAGMLSFVMCAVTNRLIGLRRRKPAIARPPVPPAGLEVIHSIRSSLHEISQEIETSPVVDRSARKASTILRLAQCGVPAPEIARHVQMSRGEVDLMIQVDRQRAQRDAEKHLA